MQGTGSSGAAPAGGVGGGADGAAPRSTGSRRQFDTALKSSWGDFERELARQLSVLGEEAMVISIVSPDDDEVVPSVTFERRPDGSLRGTVPSNLVLAERHRLSRTHHAALLALGWHAPNRLEDEWHWHATFAPDLVELAVSTVVGTIRQVFGVLAPALLPGADHLLGDRHDAGDLGSGVERPTDEGAESPGFDVGFPESPDELEQMVAEILRHRGQAEDVLPDQDGDFCVLTGLVEGARHLWRRANPSRPHLEFWGPVLSHVTDPYRALLQINVLNRRIPHMRFSLKGETIYFFSDLSAQPLIRGQFEQRIDYLARQVTELAEDLADTVNGLPTKTESSGLPDPEGSP